MAARPVFHKELGAFLIGLREARGWNQSQAGDIAERRGLAGLTRQVLLRLEGGKTKNPEPSALRALAAMYEMPYEEMVARWAAYRFGVDLSGSGSDLIRHGIGVNSRAESEGSTVDLQAHARLLEELADARKTIREMRAAAKAIGTKAGKQLALAEGFQARGDQSGSGTDG